MREKLALELRLRDRLFFALKPYPPNTREAYLRDIALKLLMELEDGIGNAEASLEIIIHEVTGE